MNEFKKCCHDSVDRIVKDRVFTFVNRNYNNMLYIFYLFTSRIYFQDFAFGLKISCHDYQTAPALSCMGIGIQIVHYFLTRFSLKIFFLEAL